MAAVMAAVAAVMAESCRSRVICMQQSCDVKGCNDAIDCALTVTTGRTSETGAGLPGTRGQPDHLRSQLLEPVSAAAAAQGPAAAHRCPPPSSICAASGKKTSVMA